MIYQVIMVINLLLAGLIGYFGYTVYEKGNDIAQKVESAERQVKALQVDLAQMQQYPDKPVIGIKKTISDLLTQVRLDADLLGSAARIGYSGASGRTRGSSRYRPYKYGLAVSSVNVNLATVSHSAPALFNMIAEKVFEQNVELKRSELRPGRGSGSGTSVVSYSLELDIYGSEKQ